MRFSAVLWVFLGGGLGSVVRYALSVALQTWSVRFPWATLAANGLACLALGYWLGLQGQGLLPEQRRLLLATGFCGGLSTFSTFTAETWRLAESGYFIYAAANTLLNLLVCLTAFWLGLRAAG